LDQSLCFFNAFVALKEKGVSFEMKEIELGKENLKPEFYDASITGRVPSLQIGDFFLAESSAIIEYIDEVYEPKNSLLPKDVKQRARARQIMAWLRSDLGGLREERPTTSMFYEKIDKPLSTKGEDAVKRLLHVAEILIPENGGNLFGEYSIVDSEFAFMLHRLVDNGHEVPSKVLHYATEQWKRPSVREFLDHKRKPYVSYN